jgi:hypothetical protein
MAFRKYLGGRVYVDGDGRFTMNFTTAYRVPYGSTPIVRSGATAPLSGTNLGRAIVLTQLVLMALCGARVATDWLRGQATIEGCVALALFCAFTIWLIGEAIGGATRSATSPPAGSPYR